MGVCTVSTPVDTDNNATELHLRRHQRDLGGCRPAPGRARTAEPVVADPAQQHLRRLLIDATVVGEPPAEPGPRLHQRSRQNSTFGTISLRRRFVNNTGGNVTRLRYRVVDITTFPAPSGFADLRPRTSASVVVAGIADAATCAATGAPATPPCTVTVQGTTLETPPAQPNGSGFNGSMSAGTVTLGTPLANGASINLQFLNGIQQTGNFKVYLNIEALP